MALNEPPLNLFLITPKECQKILRIGKNKIYEILNTDESFPAFRVGNKWLIHSNLVKDWVEKQINLYK